MVSLAPAVRDCEVPCVVPSVSLVLVPEVSEVPSVRDRDVPCDTPCDSPLLLGYRASRRLASAVPDFLVIVIAEDKPCA